MSRSQAIIVVALVLGALWVGARVLNGQGVLTLEQPTVVAGPDVGFRIERVERGIPVGKLVVRVDGKWVDAQFAGGAVRLVQ